MASLRPEDASHGSTQNDLASWLKSPLLKWILAALVFVAVALVFGLTVWDITRWIGILK